MKKSLCIVVICLLPLMNYAQGLSYGILFGENSYTIKTEGGAIKSARIGYSINIGGFVDYQFSERFGVKGNLFYAAAVEDNYNFKGPSSPFDLEPSTIQFIPHLKFDVSKVYNKGFYLLAGPRVSFLVNEKDDDGNEIEGFYNSTHFGAQFGIGVNLLKHFALELVGDVSLTDVLEISTKGTYQGAYANLNINLESLLNN